MERSIPFLPPPKSVTHSGALSCHKAKDFQELQPTRGQQLDLPASLCLVENTTLSSPQAYRIRVADPGIEIHAAGPLAWHYGLLTLKQVADASEGYLPQLEIEDSPDFDRRGIMLDVSRNKVPKLDTLFHLVDQFASWKINELQLYIEHTFAYEGHEEVWRNAAPFTKEDIRALDSYCRERFIELVPNLNCFGHMSRWLTHEPYRQLAEQPDGGETDFGHRDEPQGLCAIDPGSIRLAEDLIDQMTACFNSRQVNVGCDETIDLGYGRSKQAVEERGRGAVYMDYLKQVYELCNQRGYKMQFWADILLKYPDLIVEAPTDCIALNWGYEAIHPFDEETAQLQSSGKDYYVCPGTSSWNSIGGRTENMLGNIRKAADCGKRHGALGLLITDWGDNGHLQPLLSSFAGFVFGAASAWNPNGGIPMASLLDHHVFQQPGWGKLLLDIGNLDQALELYIHNQSILFQLLKEEAGFIREIKDLDATKLEKALANANQLSSRFEELKTKFPTSEILVLECEWVLQMLIHACRRGLAILSGDRGTPLQEEAIRLRDYHERIWKFRNRTGGYVSSRKFFDVLLGEGSV